MGEPVSSDFAPTTTAQQSTTAPTGRRVRHPAFRRVGLLGGLAVTVAATVALLEIGQALLAFSAREDYLTAAAAGTPRAEVTTWYDLSALVTWMPLVPAYVVTCAWLYRARQNVEAFVPWMPHKRGSVWAWLGWWVPIVSLWFPYQVVRDVLRAGRGQVGGVGFVGWWWAFWLLTSVTGSIAPTLGFLLPFLENSDELTRVDPATGLPATTLADLPPSETWADLLPWLEVFSAGVVLVAFLLWWAVVTEVNRDQEARAVLAAREAGLET